MTDPLDGIHGTDALERPIPVAATLVDLLTKIEVVPLASLRKGDVVVFNLQQKPDQDEVRMLDASLHKFFPWQKRIYLGPGESIEIYRSGEVE